MFDNQPNNIQQTDTQNEMSESPINLILKYIHHWKWIVLSVIIALVVGVVYFKRQTPIYTVSTTVLMNDKSKSASDIQAIQRMAGANMNGSSLDNEMILIRSKNMMAKVVNELQLHVNISQEFRFRSADLYKRTPINVDITRETSDRIKSPLALKITPNNQGAIIEGKYAGVDIKHKVESFPADLNLPFGSITLQRAAITEKWSEPVDLTIVNPLTKAAQLSARVQVSPLVKQGGTILRLTITESDVPRGVDILNKVVEVYNDNAKTTQNEKGVNTNQFINERLVAIQKELSQVETDVEEYKRDNKLVGIVADGGTAISKVAEVESKLTQFELERTLLKYIEEYVSTPTNSYAIIPNLGVSDPAVTAIISEYNQMITSRDRLLRTSSDSNPTVIAVTRDIESMRTNILDGISLARRQIELTEREMKSQMRTYDSKLSEVPRQQRELTEILRQQKIKEGLYIFLLEKREENALTMALATPEARIIEDPAASGLIAPKGAMIMLAALVIGLALPIGIIVIMILLDVKIHDRHDIENLTQLPILGELCHVKEAKGNRVVVVSKSSTSAISELLRSVRNNLQYLSGADTRKVITITSNLPTEGKSFVAANLAVTFALTGKRVLLLGLDLRNPQLHRIFNHQSEGMTNYLSGQVDNWRSLVSKMDDFSGLDLIVAGPVPPNPNELLMSQRVDDMIKEMRDSYDYIIIDSAPVGVISDTFLLNRVTDTNLFVVRAGYSAKKSIQYVNRIVSEGKLSNLYILANDVNMDSNVYRYGRYGYGYGYYGGYGYGQKKEKK
ncbi:MAG: GumC family protein [Bacteroidales bacterium]